MGQEIVYCSGCQIRLTGSDFDKGGAVRVGTRVACRNCAVDLLGSLSPGERAELDAQKNRKTASGRFLPVRPPSTTRLTRVNEPEPSSRNLWIGLGVGGAILAVALAVAFSGGSTPERRRDPEPVAPRVPEKAEEDLRTKEARAAIERVKKQVKDRPDDVDANAAAAQEALQRCENTPVAPEARELREAVLSLRKTAYAKEFSQIEKEVAVPAGRGDFERATAILQEVRKRHATDEWSAKVDQAMQAYRKPEPPPPPPPVNPPPPPPPEKAWRPLFDGKTLSFLNPQSHVGWKVEDGALVKAGRDAGQSAEEFGDGEFRFRFEASGVDSIYFRVRQGAGGRSISFNTSAYAPLLGRPHELVFICAGDKVTATLDGVPQDVSAEPTPLRGRLQFNATAKEFRILAVEIR